MPQISKLIFLLFPVFSMAQTWPDSTCPDRPYTKGNDGIIYHTCDCAVKPKEIVFITGEDSTIVEEDAGTGKIISVIQKKKPLNEKRDSRGWRILQPQSLVYCPVCDHMREYSHLMGLETGGVIVRVKDSVFINNKFFNTFLSATDNRELAKKYLASRKHD